MKNKSLKLNTILSIIKGALSVVFPLITFPYVSRVLGVENLGKFNYSNSIVSYFILFAGLGINAYAIREIARIRDDRNNVLKTSSEIFFINLISTIASYISLFLLIILVPGLSNYKIVILIFSVQILLKTIGVEWIFAAYEDYVYITVRSIIFQIISIFLMFVFVRNENDLYVYTAIATFSTVGSNILNFFRSRKYTRFKFTNLDLKKHLKPILILFANAVAVTIYVSSDITILGIICGDYSVGIYSVSVKVYTIMKTILSSALVVSVPRLSAVLEKDRGEFEHLSTSILKTLLSFAVPCVFGLCLLSREIILIISTESYSSASTSLCLLSVALFFCISSWFLGNNILIPLRKEKVVFRTTIASALINVVFNFLLIPFWQENAAAFTTIISEAFTCIVFFYFVKKENIFFSGVFADFIKILVGCIAIVFICCILRLAISDPYIFSITAVFISAVVYFMIQFILKNESLCSIFDSIKRKFSKRV